MRYLFLPLIFLISLHAFGQTFDNGFNFYLPPDDSTTQQFLPAFPASQIADFITINADGHFESNGETIRFWGANMIYGACFPEKTKAPFIAARLRKMGFNLVRFHLFDSQWVDEEETIFYTNSNTTQVLNFFALDRLHYFIAQLKEQGIYTNLNLHVARNFKEGDGVLHADSIQQNAKAVSIFDSHLVELQKQFALQLLTPINSYTGLSLAEDPALAMIEITDENTLYGFWKSDMLRHQSEGGLLIQRHVDSLDQKWNEFLQNKYADQAALEAAWNGSASTNGANEQALDVGFENDDPSENWIMELHQTAFASMHADTVDPFEGNLSCRVDVEEVTGTNWHIQFKQVGATIEAGKTYQIKFAAKAESPRQLLIYAGRDNAPWNGYGAAQASLTTDWQEFTFPFSTTEDNDGFVRIGYQFNSNLGSYWIDNVSLTDSEISGTLPGESLDQGNIQRPLYSQRQAFTDERMNDATIFYLSIQKGFFDEMYSFLKDDLGIHAAITGSSSFSGVSDIYTVQDLDYTDEHGNWDYIRYYSPWTADSWEVDNTPMLQSGNWTPLQSVFSGLAMKGKPFTISKYGHSFPNRYHVEMIPWLTAYGAFHDADALIFREYNYSHDNWTKDMVDDYYSFHRNTAIMALSPIYAYAYREGLIAPANNVHEIEYSPDYIHQLHNVDGHGRWGKFVPYDTRLAYTEAIRTKFGGTGTPDLSQLPPPAGTVATTSTTETTIDFDQGILKTETPKFVSVCGFIDETSVSAGPMDIISANDFATLAWLSLTDQPLSEADESVIVVSSKLQNSNMTWSGTTSFNSNWGGFPTEMFPMQATLELEVDALYLQVYPLNEIGEKGDPILLLPNASGNFIFEIDQLQDQTVWYGIEALNTNHVSEIDPDIHIKIAPNPASQTAFISLEIPGTGDVSIQMVDGLGRSIESICTNKIVNYHLKEEIDLNGIVPGTYFLKCQIDNEVFYKKMIVQ